MTLTSLLADTYRRLRYATSPPSAVTTRLTAYLNETQRELLTTPGLERLRDDVMIVTALANNARTGLPITVARVQAIVDRGNNFKLAQVPLDELRVSDPAQAFTGGYPLRYSIVGNQATQIQPVSTGSGLWVVSSAAGDTTQKVYVESVLLGGYPQKEISGGTALNGTTRVAIGARTDHIKVTKFYLDAAGVGFVSLYDAAAAGNELARLPIGETFSRYLAVEWWPIQTADVTEYADYTRAIFDLVNGTDEPLLHRDFHPLLAIGARRKEYEALDDTRLTRAEADYQQGVKALRSWVLNDGDRIASLRPVIPRWNNLGSAYPATSLS